MRFDANPVSSHTGRTLGPATENPLLGVKALRPLVQNPENSDTAIYIGDYIAEEALIAAHSASDRTLLAVCTSSDPYLKLAELASFK